MNIKAWALPLIVLVGALWFSSGLSESRPVPPESVLSWHRAEIAHLEGGSSLRPGEWVELPHDWRETPQARQITYRLRFELEATPHEVWSLYLPASSPPIDVRLDGQSMETPNADVATRIDLSYRLVPQLIQLPLSKLSPGEHTLELELALSSGVGFMGSAHAGPRAELEPAFARQSLIRVTSIRLVFVGVVFFVLFLLTAWAFRPADTFPLWLAVSFGLIAASMWGLATWDLPVPHPATTHVGNGWILLAIVGMMHRFLQIERPRLELGFAVFAAITMLARFGLPTGGLQLMVLPPLLVLTLVAGLYPAFLVLRAMIIDPPRGTPAVLAAGVLVLPGAAHDAAVVGGFLPRDSPTMLGWAVAGAAVLFGWVFVLRYIDALGVSESLNEKLEERVRDRGRELAANYQRLAELEREQAIATERERLMEELHDGTGGQIASALALLRSPEASRESVQGGLQRALQDMRLIVHSLDTRSGDLASLLGILRDQIEPVLESAGAKLRWSVTDTPPPQGYGPSMALHILRILQEALGNAVEHGAPTEVTLWSDAERGTEGEDWLVVGIQDNGRGLGDATAGSGRPGRGRGRGNMQKRAERIGAVLELSDANPGTRVTLRLPMAGSAIRGE